MDWKELDAEQEALVKAQDEIEHELATLTASLPDSEAIRLLKQRMRGHAQRLAAFIIKVSRLRQ
jgi:hypothetical protein